VKTDAVATTTAFLFSGPPDAYAHPNQNTYPMTDNLKFAVRCRPGNANHHLWNNAGTFWCHVTVHLPDFTKARLRLPLNTKDTMEARGLRDSIFALFGICCSQTSSSRERHEP
jgi:hypothetical protein